jgi:AcrR family transcriptional regulator
MAATKQVSLEAGGRQAAYSARNRARLIRAAQEVLANIGPSASIEQIAAHAEFSPTTIYKYFESKEALFSAALGQIWSEWVAWSYDGMEPGGSLESVIDNARKLFWIKETHPLLAKILQHVLPNPTFLIQAVQSEGRAAFRKLADMGALSSEDFDIRILLWAHALSGIMSAVHITSTLTPAEAERAMMLGLKIFDVDQERLGAIMSRELKFPPVP